MQSNIDTYTIWYGALILIPVGDHRQSDALTTFPSWFKGMQEDIIPRTAAWVCNPRRHLKTYNSQQAVLYRFHKIVFLPTIVCQRGAEMCFLVFPVGLNLPSSLHRPNRVGQTLKCLRLRCTHPGEKTLPGLGNWAIDPMHMEPDNMGKSKELSQNNNPIQ